MLVHPEGCSGARGEGVHGEGVHGEGVTSQQRRLPQPQGAGFVGWERGRFLVLDATM